LSTTDTVVAAIRCEGDRGARRGGALGVGDVAVEQHQRRVVLLHLRGQRGGDGGRARVAAVRHALHERRRRAGRRRAVQELVAHVRRQDELRACAGTG